MSDVAVMVAIGGLLAAVAILALVVRALLHVMRTMLRQVKSDPQWLTQLVHDSITIYEQGMYRALTSADRNTGSFVNLPPGMSGGLSSPPLSPERTPFPVETPTDPETVIIGGNG